MSSQYAPREATNCSPTCAEMQGGHCPGDTCVYKPTIFDTTDPILEAEFRGYLRGLRHEAAEYRRGLLIGFWIGVLTVFAGLFLLALIQWAAS